MVSGEESAIQNKCATTILQGQIKSEGNTDAFYNGGGSCTAAVSSRRWMSIADSPVQRYEVNDPFLHDLFVKSTCCFPSACLA